MVTRLISDVSGSAQNITFDDWYANIPRVESLFCDHNLTAVGTLRKNKRKIPQKFLMIKNKPPADSMFGFKNSLTLVSYMSNIKIKKKNVILISSMHHDNKIDRYSGDNKKPKIITLYNSLKGGVDEVDMIMGKCSVSRNSRHWPLTIFFALMNIYSVNSYILYVYKPQNTLKGRTFIKKVSQELLEEHLKRRLHNYHLEKSLQALQDCRQKLQLQ